MPQVARAASAAGIGWAVLNKRPDYLAELRAHGKSTHLCRQFRSLRDWTHSRKAIRSVAARRTVLFCTSKDLRRVPRRRERELGMLETKPSNIQLAMLKGEWTEESAGRSVRSWLKLATSQSSSIKLVGAQDDSMAMGARKAFQEITNEAERSRWLSLPFTGCDGQPATGQVLGTRKAARGDHSHSAARGTSDGDSRKGHSGREPNRLSIS